VIPQRSMEQASGSGRIWERRVSVVMVWRRLAMVWGTSGWEEGSNVESSGVGLF
jgi:hypothetical protein